MALFWFNGQLSTAAFLDYNTSVLLPLGRDPYSSDFQIRISAVRTGSRAFSATESSRILSNIKVCYYINFLKSPELNSLQ